MAFFLLLERYGQCALKYPMLVCISPNMSISIGINLSFLREWLFNRLLFSFTSKLPGNRLDCQSTLPFTETFHNSSRIGEKINFYLPVTFSLKYVYEPKLKKGLIKPVMFDNVARVIFFFCTDLLQVLLTTNFRKEIQRELLTVKGGG